MGEVARTDRLLDCPLLDQTRYRLSQHLRIIESLHTFSVLPTSYYTVHELSIHLLFTLIVHARLNFAGAGWSTQSQCRKSKTLSSPNNEQALIVSTARQRHHDVPRFQNMPLS